MSLKPSSFELKMLELKAAIMYCQWPRILKLGLGITVAALLAFTLAGTLIEQSSMFTISLLPASKEGDAEISLSETADFANPTTVLDAGGLQHMTNISEQWLPSGLDSTDGSHNGDNYIAYTFYLRNVGDTACTLKEEIHIDSAVLGADAAIRVRMYRDGEPTTYAKMAASGIPEYGTTPFESEDSVVSCEVPDFRPGDTRKYTLVIWLEGDDPECLDNIRGGNVKMSMTFTSQEEPQQ